MVASDYVEQALYRQREQEMNLRNERRRIVLDRQGIRPGGRGKRSRHGLPYIVRQRLTELFSSAPARG